MGHKIEFFVTIIRKVLCRVMLEKLIKDNPFYQKKQYTRVENFKIYKLEISDQDPSIALTKHTTVNRVINAHGQMLLCVERKGQKG